MIPSSIYVWGSLLYYLYLLGLLEWDQGEISVYDTP